MWKLLPRAQIENPHFLKSKFHSADNLIPSKCTIVHYGIFDLIVQDLSAQELYLPSEALMIQLLPQVYPHHQPGTSRVSRFAVTR
jgi:hypothetical protein